MADFNVAENRTIIKWRATVRSLPLIDTKKLSIEATRKSVVCLSLENK